jgi:hypothetical protein
LKVGIILDYTTNFRISQNFKRSFKKNKNLLNFRKREKKNKSKKVGSPALLCKNTLYFLLLINNNLGAFSENSYVSLISCFFFLKKPSIKYYTLLRAPYRYKIARSKIQFKRFNALCFLKFKYNNVASVLKIQSSFKDLTNTLSSLSNIYKDINTSMCNQNYSVISLDFSFKNFFIFKNF